MRPKPGRFDLVLGSSMLHHLVDPFETLGALLGSLRPGGLAVFYEPFQAGNLILRQCLGEVHRRAPYHGDLPAELVEFIRVCILGLDLMFAEDRVHPVLRSLDDKWMFTRAEFAAAADRYGLAPPVISSTNPAERTWENKLTSLIYSGLGRTDGLPEWVTEVLRSADAHVSPALREEMLMEGEIIFVKPATSSAHGSA
jgi:SAM-dependent methyltransferase